MRWTNRLARTLIVLALLAGPPMALGWWVAHHRLPGLAGFQAWREQPLAPVTVIAAVLAIVAAGWLVAAVALLRHVGRRVRARWLRLRQLPVPSPAQMTATSMAGLAALALPPPGAGPASPPPAAGRDQLPTLPGNNGHGDDRGEPSAGITLPGGGWIPDRTAAVIAAVTAAVWLHRRRAYRPGSPRPGTHLDDPDLQPLPGTVSAVIAALDDDPTAAVPPEVDAPPPTEGFPSRVCLGGPGAHAGARGLLITTMLYTAAGRPLPRPIAVSHSDLQLLLPGSKPSALTAYGIAVGDPPAVDVSAATDQSYTDRPLNAVNTKPIILLMRSNQPAGTYWHVGADGQVDAGEKPRRLPVLDQHTALELLALIQHARTDGVSVPSPVTATRTETPITSGPAPAHLTLLGGCRLSVNDKPVTLRRTAGWQILAYLALHSDGATSTQLTRAVWPGLPADSISSRLYTTLSDLRRQLHPLLDADLVTRSDDRYQLNTAIISCDVPALHSAITATALARTAADCRAAGQALTTAYRGELAAGHHWPWLESHREALRRDVIDAFLELAATTDAAEAAALLAAALNTDPENQALRRRAREVPASLLAQVRDATIGADEARR